jgi:hypothetical protein
LASLISAYASNIEAELPNQQLPETCTYTEQSISDKVTLSDKNKDYPCNIRRIRYSELQTVFPPLGLVPSLYPKPFIITTDLRYNAEFAERTTICEISRQFPHNFNVTLSSSNSYSSHRRVIPLTQYLQESLDYDTSYLNKSNETWYLFGETFHPEWTQLLEHFQLPPCEMCTRPLSALSFGMAGLNSGVQWHFHGPGFSEVIHGSKHWLLLSSEFQKEGIPYYDDPTYTSFSWMEWIYPNLSTELQDALYQCTLYPGEMIYFPDSWHHATINTSPYNVFVSTFTTEYIA